MDKSKECRDAADEDSEDDDLLVEDELWELDTEDWAEEATKIFVQQCGECGTFRLTIGDIIQYWELRFGWQPSPEFLDELRDLWPAPGELIPPVDPEDPDDEVPDEGDAGEEPPSNGDEPGGPGEDDPHNPPGGDDGGGNGGSTGGGGGDGGGSGGDGPRLNTCPTTDTRDPVSGSPVRLFAGDKIEEVIDLSVSLPGRDFQLKRFYNANLSLNTLGLVANGWNLDGFSNIAHPREYEYDEELEEWVNVGPDLDRLTVFNRNRHSKESFYRHDANTFTSEDYGPIYVSRTTRVWNSNEYPVWKLVIPGQSTIYYHREPEVGEEALATVSSLLYGALWQQVDPYKNTWIYEYDEEYFTERRLSTILLNGAGSATRAKIHFTWNSLDGEDIPPGAVWGVNGRLASVSVERLSGSEWHQTAFVSYQQNLERTGAGRIGDLVKVTYGMRVDRNHDRTDSSTEAWRRLIMLYRYHGTGTVIDEFETDEVMMTTGEGGQLKAVILPEQVEYLASLLVADGMNKGVALYRAAEALINADDGAPAWEGTSGILTPLDLAAKVIGYDNEGRVEVQYIQSGCGCAGVGHGMKETFEYISYGTSTYATTVLREYAIENDVYELYRTTYTDMKMIRATPYLENRVIESPPLVENGPVQRWVWHYEYLEARSHLLREYYPSAMSTYTPGSAVGPVLPSYTAHTTTGLVYEYAHDAQGRRTEVLIRDDTGVFQRVSRVTYSTDTALGRPDLMVKNERFRVAGSTDPEDIEVIEYEYGLYNSSDPTAGIAWMKTIYENELTSENGTGGTLYSATLYDSNGDEFWHKNADGSLTYRDHDSRSGIVDKLTHNASRSATVDNPALPSDFFGLDTDAWGRNSEGWSLTESGQLDMQGRVKSWTSVGGVTRYMLHEVAPLDTDTNGLGYYRVLSLPDEINAGVFTGPAMSTWQNAAGRVLLSNARLVTATSYTPLSYEFTLGTEVSRASATYSLTGSRSAQRVWHDVAGNGSYETLFEYDAVGRVLSVTSPSGTVTYNASYDVFDRVLETKIGTSSTNAVTIAKYFYDHEMDGSNPVQGVGDGNLTLTRLYVDGTTHRDTIRRFDSRNRVEWVIPPLPPFEYFEYDNLDRMVARSIFSELPTGTPGDIEDDRGLYERTYYSQRGLVYKSTRTDQPQDISSTNANDVIGTWIWYDAAGRPIKQFSANSPVVKRKYDGHGRTVAMYLSDGGGDGGVGGSYSHATHVNSDEVIEQTKYEFDTQSGDWPGQLTLATTWRRLHDAAGTGELTAAGTSPTAIATYTGYYYDDASRPLRTVSFGTSSSSDTFEAGTSAPSWPPSSVPTMTSHPNAIVTGVKYDVQGRIYESIDTLGRVSRTFFDDLGRTIAISENFDDASVSWNGTALNWEVDGLDRTEPDVDRVTTYAYDASGGLWKQTAHIPDPDPMAPATDVLAQVTEYVRTHTAASSPSTLLTSNSIVHEIRYPDETTGLAGTGAQYRVAYKYNRLGELIEFTDQNATVHAYERDSLGRLTADKVSAFGSQIDDRIKRIDTSYDTFGRLERVTSLTSTTDTAAVANEVAYTYTALWQVSDLYQNAGESVYTSGGSVRSSTKRVQYHHETGYPLDDDYKNYSRLKKISYPSKPVGSTVDETELIYEYLEGTSSDGLDARVSRPIALKVSNQVTSGSSMLAAYERIGMGMYAIVDYPLVGGEGLSGVQLDRTLAHDSTGAVAVGSRRFSSYAAADLKGVYPGLDRFGRTKTQAWVDGLLTVHATNDAVPNRPPIVLERYGYDAASNPLTRLDARPGAHLVNRDFAFSYDALDRLVGSDRGVASTSTWGKAGTQDWSLDMLGNWSQFRWDRNGDGDFDEGAETEQREHNLANEILSRVQENPLPLSDTTLNLTHDHAGNMRTKYESSVVRMELTHDAWNRLVRIRRLTSNIEDPPLDVSEQEFNGLHWRVVSREDTDADGTLDEKRELVYSSSWQVLEEFVDEDYVSSPGTDRRVQQFWGLRHLDDAIMSREQDPVSGEIGRTSYKLTDRQFSVVAVLDVSGELMERVTYDPYGRAQHRWPADFNGDGYMDGTDTGSASLFTSIGASGYRADEDLNRDGVTDIDDMVIAYLWGSKGPLPSGQISDPAGPGNRVGYAGYRFEPSSTLYHVRFRWYDTGLGRWAQRDPAGYIDGMGLYQYVSAIPTASHDSMGLWPRKYHGMSKQQQARLERAFNKAVANAREMRKQVPSLREDLRALDPCVADIMEPLISQLDDRLSTLISGFESSDNEIHVRDSAFKMLSLRGKGIPNAETRQHFPTVSEMGNAVLYPPYYSITLAAKKQTPDLYDWNSWDDDKLAVQIFHELVHVSEYEVGDPDFDRNESVLVNAVHMEETIANGNVDIRSGTAMLRLFDAAKRECGCDSKKPRP